MAEEPGAALDMTIFYDVEASSLSDASYPIEVAWAIVYADLCIRAAAVLVKPAVDWTDWSAPAAAVHGIARSDLERLGCAARDVVRRLHRNCALPVIDPWLARSS